MFLKNGYFSFLMADMRDRERNTCSQWIGEKNISNTEHGPILNYDDTWQDAAQIE